jgi:two-component system, cell cycle sensor histidine kinase and response regulator CckA
MHSPPQSRYRRASRKQAEQQQRVLEVAKALSGTLGGDFFGSLVEHLTGALAVDYAYVAELTSRQPARLKTVAVFDRNAAAENFEVDLAGTASSRVLDDGAVCMSVDAWRMFPLDPLLERMGAEAYVGFRLSDSNGQIIGVFAICNVKRAPDLQLVESVLQTFSNRAAAELERKRAYDTVKESEERYRVFIASSADAMWRVELEKPISLDLSEQEQIEAIHTYGYLAECNDSTAKLAGAASADHLVGARFSELFSGKDNWILDELRVAVRSRFAPSSVQTRPMNSHGEWVYRLRTLCGIVVNNHLVRIWGTTRDITELKQAELAVESAERRFREALENIQVPALMLSATGQITFCNDTLARLIGSSKSVLTGRNWLDVMDWSGEGSKWMEVLAEGAEWQGGRHIETVIHLRDRSSRLIAWDTIVLRDEAGAFAGLAAIGSSSQIGQG